MSESDPRAPLIVGRYAIFDPIAAGGMATVHLGRLLGEVGFTRSVAIKRLHKQYAADPDFVAMFIDEARIAARVRHPNVVQTLDVGAIDGELFVVMDYVEGESLSRIFRSASADGKLLEANLVARVMVDALHGLHAAHEAKNEAGEPLEMVHRDVSPQNVLVGVDGISRVLDFGIAKAVGQVHTTQKGELKGKIAYMAPEQLLGQDVTRRTDVFAASIMFWELLVGQRLFGGGSEGEVVHKVLDSEVAPPSARAPGLSPALDAVVMKGLERDPRARFASAAEMAEAIEACVPLASPRAVGAWVREHAAEPLAMRAQLLAAIEKGTTATAPSPEDSRRIAAEAALTAVPTERLSHSIDVVVEASLPTSGVTRLTYASATPARAPGRQRTAAAVVVLAALLSVVAWRALRPGAPQERDRAAATPPAIRATTEPATGATNEPSSGTLPASSAITPAPSGTLPAPSATLAASGASAISPATAAAPPSALAASASAPRRVRGPAPSATASTGRKLYTRE